MKFFTKLAPVGALALLATLALAGNALGAQAPVPLGTAASFGVLSNTGVTTSGATTINGDLGSAGAITGAFVVTGVNYGAGGLTPGARADEGIAYTTATNTTFAPSTATIALLGSGNGVPSLGPGVYDSGSTLGVTGALNLAGGPSDVFIFRAASSLTVNPGSSITLSGGAQACNVFWAVGSSATLNNGGGTFVGTVLASASATVTAAAVAVDGRLFAGTGNVTFISSVVTVPTCASGGGGGSGGGASGGGGGGGGGGGAAAPAAPAPPTPPPPGRELYCSPTGQSYDLVAGQDKQPPYDTLGLVVAQVDPVTGAKTCDFVRAAPTPVPAATTTPTPVAPAPVTPAPVASAPKPTPAQTAAAKAKAAAAKAEAAKAAAKAAQVKAAAKTKAAKRGQTTSTSKARPAVRRAGFTG